MPHQHMSRFSGVPLMQSSRLTRRVTLLCLIAAVLTSSTLFFDYSFLTEYEGTGQPHHRPAKIFEAVKAWTRTSIYGLPSHEWDKNGLLTVNPAGAHPIYELVRHAEAQWATKKRRASKTLRQAVREYKMRYGRSPPRGFEHWWDYVQKHDVQLPDEYDQIYHDLEPYWGVDPLDLQETQSRRESLKGETYTIGKNITQGTIELLNITSSNGREEKHAKNAKPQIELMDEVFQYIPPFRATFNPDDSPLELVDFSWRNAALDAAKRGTFLKPDDLLPSVDKLGWAGGCPRDSPLYLNTPRRLDEPTPQTSKTFIYDHQASMDPCYHPQHILNHGTFLAHGTGPRLQRFPAPMLSTCATPLHGDIRGTSMAQTSGFLSGDPVWEDKNDTRLFWRGTPTGMMHHKGVNWRFSQRVRLTNLTRSTGFNIHRDLDTEQVSFLNPGASGPVGPAKSLSRHRTNEAHMDISFAGKNYNCKPELCEIMQKELPWGDRVNSGAQGAGRYKFLLDIDGNGWSQRFRQLMSTNALIFKSTVYPEWWIDRVQPWVHYVPVQLDYSDLYDSLLFFAGDQNGKNAHDEMAKRIASAGRQWAEKFWRKEDMTAYMFRLWLEYARVMSPNRDEMNYQY